MDTKFVIKYKYGSDLPYEHIQILHIVNKQFHINTDLQLVIFVQDTVAIVIGILVVLQTVAVIILITVEDTVSVIVVVVLIGQTVAVKVLLVVGDAVAIIVIIIGVQEAVIVIILVNCVAKIKTNRLHLVQKH